MMLNNSTSACMRGSSSACACAPLPLLRAPAVLRQQQQQRRPSSSRGPCRGRGASTIARAALPPPDEFGGSSSSGDEAVQAALEDQLRLQLRSEAIKEEIRVDLRSKIEDVKRISEDLSAQLDEGYRIEAFRNDLEAREALSSAMEKFDAIEQEIAAMRAALQADREDLAAWERASAAARSEGLFFKSLYKPSDDALDGGSAGSGSGSGNAASSGGAAGGGRFSGELRGSLDPEAAAAARRAAARVAVPAVAEVGSPLRLWLFGGMAAVLVLVVAQDLTTPEPAQGLDALYAVLALLLGLTAWQERGALAAKQQSAEQQLQQLQQGAGQPRLQKQSAADGGGAAPPPAT